MTTGEKVNSRHAERVRQVCADLGHEGGGTAPDGVCRWCGERIDPRTIYVASSWRCEAQPGVVMLLRAAGHVVYDFRNPPGRSGFSWRDVGGAELGPKGSDLVRADDYMRMIEHPRAQAGFASDFEAMEAADAFVLVLPCGRSAHLELGWAVGAGKRTCVILDDPVEPELMYRLVDKLARNVEDVIAWLDEEPIRG